MTHLEARMKCSLAPSRPLQFLELKEVGLSAFAAVHFLSPLALQGGRGRIALPAPRRPASQVEGRSCSLLCLERLGTSCFELKRLQDRSKRASWKGLGVAAESKSGPPCSQSCDLPLNWTRGSLSLLFFPIPFWKMNAF